MSLKQSTFYDVENSTPMVELEPTISITYRVPLIVIMTQSMKTMHLKYISKYQGFQTKKMYMKMTKIWIADVWWQPL